MECEARIDDWLDRELMSRLALVSSLEEGRDEVEEGLDDGGGDDSKLAVILLPLIIVDADESTEVAYEDMEVFAMLDVAMAVAAGLSGPFISRMVTVYHHAKVDVFAKWRRHIGKNCFFHVAVNSVQSKDGKAVRSMSG
jgi:hypothetical protein